MVQLLDDGIFGRAVFLATWVILSVQSAYTQQLSIRHYDTHDGLAHTRVSAIHQDAKGYLWIGTWQGLSRFDGYRFVNYDTRDGLGHILVNAITEDQQGRLWVATNDGGVSRLIDVPTENRPRSSNASAPARKSYANFRVRQAP